MKVPEGYVLITVEEYESLRSLLPVVARQEKRIKELEARLNMNSSNSSKPPSSDSLKRQTKSLRKKSNRKSGGQHGHKGSRLEMSSNPDFTEALVPDCCAHCGGGDLLKKSVEIERRQVFDIPPPSEIEITEYQSHFKICRDCGGISYGAFPQGVTQQTQYGSRLKSLIVYLSGFQMLPTNRIKRIISDVFDWNISEGTVHNTITKSAELLTEHEEWVKEQLKASPVIGCDETGMRVNGKTLWAHTANNPHYSLLTLHNKRGIEAMDDIGILPAYEGQVVHDRWASYFIYENCKHRLCNAHLLRELKYIHEDMGYPWAEGMIQLLLEAKRISERKRGPTARQVKEISHRYTQIIAWGLRICTQEGDHVQKSKRGASRQSKPKNLLDDMKKHKEPILAFLTDPDVPFDNNASERDIRMLKVKMKVSGAFRSDEGGQAFTRIRGFINTAIKQQVNVLEAIDGIFNNSIFTLQPAE